MSADRLREAARVLRAVVDGLTTDTARWDEAFLSSNVYGDHSTYERVIMHPGVGLALADWLDAEASAWDFNGWQQSDEASAVADAILGSAE